MEYMNYSRIQSEYLHDCFAEWQYHSCEECKYFTPEEKDNYHLCTKYNMFVKNKKDRCKSYKQKEKSNVQTNES